MFLPKLQAPRVGSSDPYQQLLQQSFLPTSYHPVQCQGYNKEELCLFSSKLIIVARSAFLSEFSFKGVAAPHLLRYSTLRPLPRVFLILSHSIPRLAQYHDLFHESKTLDDLGPSTLPPGTHFSPHMVRGLRPKYT